MSELHKMTSLRSTINTVTLLLSKFNVNLFMKVLKRQVTWPFSNPNVFCNKFVSLAVTNSETDHKINLINKNSTISNSIYV